MTRLFKEDGTHVPVTVLHLDEVQVVDARTAGARRLHRRAARHRQGQGEERHQAEPRPFRPASRSSRRRSCVEFRVAADAVLEAGASLSAAHFVVGQKVDVTGTSKGKGFAGGMKRWNFGGLEASARRVGQPSSLGSTGNRQDPGKTFKNKKMAGPSGSGARHHAESRDCAVDAEQEPDHGPRRGPRLRRATSCWCATRSRRRAMPMRRIRPACWRQRRLRPRRRAG